MTCTKGEKLLNHGDHYLVSSCLSKPNYKAKQFLKRSIFRTEVVQMFGYFCFLNLQRRVLFGQLLEKLGNF